MIKSFYFILLFSLTSFTTRENKLHASSTISSKTTIDDKLLDVYNSLNNNGFLLPNSTCFITALNGFYNLKEKGEIEKNILTVINFDLPSTEKRLWVVDLNLNKIIFHTYVSHGRNSGEVYATSFSNEEESYKSSLGFFSTGEIYTGKNGLSLKLDGLEKGINDKARERAIVIHGADYVSKQFISTNNKLGRSQGCPALPVELNEKIIKKINNKSCLFIYKSDKKYMSLSKLMS